MFFLFIFHAIKFGTLEKQSPLELVVGLSVQSVHLLFNRPEIWACRAGIETIDIIYYYFLSRPPLGSVEI